MKREVTKYRICVALLFGAAFTSLLVLLLNIAPLFLSLVIFGLLSFGGVPMAVLSRSSELEPPLAMMALNALAYGTIAYIAVSTFWRSSNAATMRRVAVWLVLPAAFFVCLACVPAINPLWPRGMSELTKQESELQAALPLGVELSQCRAVLQSKGIQFREETESSAGVILERVDRTLTADAGDRVLSARFQTAASAFPCGYDMEIVLLFGRDDKLRQQYIHRLRLCP
jgi:hypothetical protein